MRNSLGGLIFIFLIAFQAQSESIRVNIAGINTVSLEGESTVVPLSFTDSSLIQLEGDIRFLRGIELELSAPHNYLSHRGSLAVAVYGILNKIPETGIADLECLRLGFDPMPPRIQTIYQIPLRADHGFRTSPYATVLTNIVNPMSFPLIFRLMPVAKEISAEMEMMVFNLAVKPILSDEGAVRINFRYPVNLQGRPLTVLLNDEVISNPEEELILKEGEHQLVILSEDYRNQSSRFIVERAKTIDLTVELQDPTPLVIFEHPENARVFLNNVLVSNSRIPRPVEPGAHEVRFQISDYTIIRPITVQRGKSYRVSLSVDVDISETE